ncbi:M23 family metallopeptidase [Pseudoalteromonas piscicida]|uniref:M23 family metallopeptidase n=1 Tax=Pseudoalteromonas piscicida TaxID=43662 RepID=UPI000E35CAAB|nr:peptidoglycan DD-metalloendopeptidase family protein [Pseudoalteromonas piscicida]AXQ97735.1 M23 family peptidase [Pseudoalteromonas piscicida]
MIKKLSIAIAMMATFGCSKQPEQTHSDNKAQESTLVSAQPDRDQAVVHNETAENSVASQITQEIKPAQDIRLLELKSGESLANLLSEFAFSDRDSWLVEQAVSTWTSLTKLRAGQLIEAELVDGQVQQIRFEYAFAQVIEIKRVDEQWHASLSELETVTQTKRLSTSIDSSFFVDASKIGVPNDIINQSIVALSHLVDFQREVYAGDQIDFVFQEQQIVAATELLKQISKASELQHVALLSGKEKYRLYRFTDNDGTTAFYHPDGTLAQSFLMKTPLNGARLSSNFGKRHHPVLGYTRMHKGIDFGAPVGTPIMAAGAGKVLKAGWGGSFGNRVVLEHGKGYQTLYAHLNGFANGLKAGTRVKQGDVIGYLGNTGLSQARHLHYEVHKDGKAINPLTLKQPKNTKLSDAKLDEFSAQVAQITTLLDSENTKLAHNEGQSGSMGNADD